MADFVTPCSSDPELWFEGTEAANAQAIAICQACPVRAACTELVADFEPSTRPPGSRFGIWGGLTPEDRARGWRKRKGSDANKRALAKRASSARILAAWAVAAADIARTGAPLPAIAKATGISVTTTRRRLSLIPDLHAAWQAAQDTAKTTTTRSEA